MVTLDAGNVLLKPSHRKQVMAWLRRSLRLGKQLGQFALTVRLQRVGNQYEVTARVKDSCGQFDCRSKRTDWRNAFRDMVWILMHRLHDHCLQQRALE